MWIRPDGNIYIPYIYQLAYIYAHTYAHTYVYDKLIYIYVLSYALPRLGSNDWRAAVLLLPRRLSFRKAPCGSPCEEVCASPSLGV